MIMREQKEKDQWREVSLFYFSDLVLADICEFW